ncbi:MAG: RNA pseudouridine synthase [Candidatus Marinimicrobia bacterium]|nr:RNA pseudouridine synthase [Candidatus Neomarinimicrobiota bacterium]
MHINIVVDDINIRLDQFLVKKLIKTSRSKIQSNIRSGNILLNGKTTKPSFLLNGGEKISGSLIFSDKDLYLKKEKMDLDVIYEDDSLIAINKKPGIVVHPGNGNHSGTLLNGLLYHFDKLSKINTDRPGIVHRLDKDTSGVIIIAKTDEIHTNLSMQFEKRLVKKHYFAIVWGKLNEKGKIEGYICRDRKQRTKFSLSDSKGKFSKTVYSCQNTYLPFSIVNLYPETGRTHQLRVHLANIGNPILCDDLYGGGYKKIKSFHSDYSKLCKQILKQINRVALHSFKLELMHPIKNKHITFRAPIPNKFKLAMSLMEKNV